ncbi:uncharacterized protein F5891DRAFT_971144, partial [Suillus fuscotomentosus]
DEVTEAISPGGHIIKRRARSRPVSIELLESVNHSPSPKVRSYIDIGIYIYSIVLTKLHSRLNVPI